MNRYQITGIIYIHIGMNEWLKRYTWERERERERERACGRACGRAGVCMYVCELVRVCVVKRMGLALLYVCTVPFLFTECNYVLVDNLQRRELVLCHGIQRFIRVITVIITSQQPAPSQPTSRRATVLVATERERERERKAARLSRT